MAPQTSRPPNPLTTRRARAPFTLGLGDKSLPAESDAVSAVLTCKVYQSVGVGMREARHFLEPLFSGRRIAIVGNAAALLSTRCGPAIDACNTVVRMNLGLPVETAAQGSRTDVLAFSAFPLVAEAHLRFGAKAYLWMSPKGRDETLPLPSPLAFYDLDHWSALHRNLGARPSVGAMVLDLVARQNPAEVEVFGYDFKRSLTFYRDKQTLGPHDFQAEANACAALCNSPGWRFIPCVPEPEVQ